ncbi:cell envelope biogenesis protein TolA [Sphingosinicella sp.]|uniref:cell envelope biogenesis protein TolA n=1 Tax=Sphingosinicella sp. TaxID=1917971 RepID=UPI0040383BDF
MAVAMERAEAAGLGVALLGHLALLAALSLGLFAAATPPAAQDAIEVSFVEDVALDSASPTPATPPPPPRAADELGPTEEAPATPSPAPVAAQPPSESDARDRRRPEEPRQTPGQRARASRLADLNLDNLGRDPSRASAPAAPAAAMTAQAAASIAQAIIRQVQPCADRQVYPGPGAERIVTSLRLRLNRDGSLQGRPVVAGQRGLDDENGRYAQRVADLAVNAFVSCAPLRGLPADLYAVPRGWSNFTMNYRLPG